MMTEPATDVPPTGAFGKIAGLYDLLDTLGSGHFAVVKLARHVFTGAKVAVKVVDKTKLDKVSQDHLYTEVRCMKLVQHPNVVRLYEVIDTQTKLYLILELGDGGDLYDYIMKHDGGLDEDLAKKYFRQILRAISYCHQLHVVHRDLKPENVVFFEKLGVVKLTDFGFSNKYNPGQKLETSCGSLAYSAPEILLGDSYDAPAVDIWSLGVILYMLVCGQPPFEKASDSETLTMIMDCKYTVPPQISQECRNLIASMLVRDPKGRATLAEIAQSDWLNKNTDEDPICDSIPLVSRQQLSDEDHAFIIQKMINGQIASKEKILKSLELNNYDHITATYYLLAELRLRKQREELALKQRNMNATDGLQKRPNLLDDSKLKNAQVKKVPIVPIAINVTSSTPSVDLGKTDKRTRKCSIVREEDEEDSACEHSGGGNELRVVNTRRESISDGRLNRSVQERTGGLPAPTPAPLPVVPATKSHNKLVLSVDATLAHKLNQIENPSPSAALLSSAHTALTAASPLFAHKIQNDEGIQDALKGFKELEIGKFKTNSNTKNTVLTHRRTKLNKIRTPSCSSSEAEAERDDETKTRNKKKMNKFCSDIPTRFRMNRRDSYDDSSDSQDQTYSSQAASGTHRGVTIIAASGNTKVDSNDKKDGQSHGKDHKQNEETRKSSSHKHKKHQQQHHQQHLQQHQIPKDNNDILVPDISDKTHTLSAILNGVKGRRRRVRESQSLDRITEAQEYELKYKHERNERNSLCNLSSYLVAETKEEYDQDQEDLNLITTSSTTTTNTIMTTNELTNALMNLNLNTNLLKRNNINNYNNNKNNLTFNKTTATNIYNIHSISELDLILENRNMNLNTLTTTTTNDSDTKLTTTTKSKAIQVAGTKCFVTIKKIRKLGKYFPVVNFSSS